MVQYILFLLAGVFLLVAIILLVIVPAAVDNSQKKCTMVVDAQIVDRRASGTSNSGSSTTFAPVYEYSFGGVTYRRQSHLYTNQCPVIGEQLKLLVNPDDPQKFSDPKRNKKTKLILRIIGVSFLVPSIILTIIALITMM